MFIHESTVNLLVSLGYTETEGCCQGFSIKWLEACLLDEEYLFDARIQQIDFGDEDIVYSIDAVKEKKGQNLTEQDKELLDILAFCDSLELYHSPRVHFSLFNAPMMQNDVDLISPVASSDAILARGGLIRVYSEPGIYTKEEVKAYFDDLGVVIEKACAKSKSKTPLGIVLSSHDHVIALMYTPGMGWKFMDINQYPSKSFMVNETDLLAERIMIGFNPSESNSPYRAFNVSVFTTGNHLGLLDLKETFDPFKKSHPLTKDIANREADGIGLARIAAQYNHAPVIAEIVKYGMDLDKVDSKGATPAIVAAQHGYVSVITELVKYGVDLNQAGLNGVTPAIIAAQNGYVSVITELAKYGVDLNQADIYEATPAYIAAQNGHAFVIAELAKYGADLNKAMSNGVTPGFIAAQNGHAVAIAELAKHGVDLNQAMNNGITPAFLAAQEGHVSVIVELIKAGVNFNISYMASVDSLRQFVFSYGENVIERMNDFIDQQLALSPTSHMISMTPYQIAAVMGQLLTMQLLNEKAEQVQIERLHVSHPLTEDTQNGHDKTIGNGYAFFPSLVKEVVASNGENQREDSGVYQDSGKKRKSGEMDDESSPENDKKRTRYPS